MRRFLLIILLGHLCVGLTYAQKKTKRVDKDGFAWYELEDEKGYQGAEDVNGRTVIPLSNEFCSVFFLKGYFYVEKNIRGTKYTGVYDKRGNEIIPVSREYCNVYFDADRCFCVEKESSGTKYIGICDKWGKEIIKPDTYKYEEYFSINYQDKPDLGIHGFYVHNLKKADSGYYNLNIFLDSEAKAYSLKNGSKIYISDGTNGHASRSYNVSKARGGKVESVWYDHDVYMNGQKGMRIHSKVLVSGYKDQPIRMKVCHFFYNEDGSKLWGNTAGYTTNARNQVAAWVEDRIKPKWEDTFFDGWSIFVPYAALHCNSSRTIKIATVLRDETNGIWIGDDAYVTYINYNAASNSPASNLNSALNPFYFPIPQFQFTPKLDLSNIQSDVPASNVPVQSSGTVNYGGGYNGGTEAGGTSGDTPRQLFTKTCGRCHGTGSCTICGGDGWVVRMGMGKDGPCVACPNHNGKCTSCGGRGTWKE